MKHVIKYVLGLDIGIGSVGWAVIRIDGTPRIEDFGVYIFDSGENAKRRTRESQKRRGYRSARRLIRRRAHRKERLRFCFQKFGLATAREIASYFSGKEKDLIALRARALDEKIAPVELAACMIHISNHRGYREFYALTEEDMSDEDLQANAAGVQEVRRLMQAGAYRTVAEMVARDKAFALDKISFPRYRNRAGYTTRYVMPREEVEKEALAILRAQQKYYPAITQTFIDKIMEILFSQRDFEDGPGDPNDVRRPYRGFCGSEGNCRFYPLEKRGHRFTYLADEYALVNALSQYKYFDDSSDEPMFPAAFAKELLNYAVQNGGMKVTDVNAIAKKYHLKVKSAQSKKSGSLPQVMKFLTPVKPVLEEAGFDWSALVAEDASDMNCLLNRIGEALSVNITPRRRRARLNAIPELAAHPKVVEKLTRHKFSGTANVSNKYMAGAVAAFLEGDIYGKYQDSFQKSVAQSTPAQRQYKLAPFGKNFEFYKNPVVMRSINQARKAINRVIEEYGSPYAINIEVGSDLGRSFQMRSEIETEQRKNEKQRRAAKETIAELLKCAESEVSPAMIERYLLGEMQGWKCLYSGASIKKEEAVLNTGKSFEVDHIVPFSLVLDNTLQNKALVCHSENQAKGQRVPLEYLNGTARKEFLARVNVLYRDQKISLKKYKYLTAASVNETEVMEEWKSRNLNDTRYISRFLVNYLKGHLQFRAADAGDPYRPEVYAVKGAITSQMRRTWLNEHTWGRMDKSELKAVTYLDHAADAIVVACCLPAYVEMTAVHQRLRRIRKENGGYPNAEYEGVLANAKQHINRYYNIPMAEIERNLTQYNRRPALIADLRREADIRLQDPDVIAFFEEEQAKKEDRKPRKWSERALHDKFRTEAASFYRDDQLFANSLEMPFTVHVPSRKTQGKITGDNAVRIVTRGDNTFKLTRKLACELTSKDLENLYTKDEDLRQSLAAVLEGRKEKTTVGEVLGERGEQQFRTQKGVPVRRVTLKTDAERTLRKQISENNYSDLPDSSYYCVEVYRDRNGFTRTTGIAFSEITIQDGKVCLKESYRDPEDYGEHCLYLFTNDYIRITKTTKQGQEKKFEGYYRAVANINQSRFSYVRYNSPMKRGEVVIIAQKDTVEKFEVDPIGRVGGKIKCGERLSSVKEKE